VVLREMIALKTFREDPSWIAKVIREPISVSQIQRAFKDLESMKLIERGADGKLRQVKRQNSTQDEVVSSAVARFARTMIDMGIKSIEEVPAKEREISSLTLGLSEAGALELKRKIQQFKMELLALETQDPSPANVIHVNFQMFPLTKIDEEKPQ
jgi:uncharacterized protein (TIGR02147 family)